MVPVVRTLEKSVLTAGVFYILIFKIRGLEVNMSKILKNKTKKFKERVVYSFGKVPFNNVTLQKA